MAVAATSKLRAWRVAAELTLEEVAGLTGLSVAMLSKAERGLRNVAPLTRVKIARRLGVPVTALFEVEPLDDEAADEALVELIEAAG